MVGLGVSTQMMAVNASVFPSSVTNSLMALGSEGSQEADDMVRPCIAIICELCEWTPTATHCNDSMLHGHLSLVYLYSRYYGHILLANISCVDIAYYTDCFYHIYFHIYIYFWVFYSYLHYSSLLCTFCVITHINHLGLIEYIWSYLL